MPMTPAATVARQIVAAFGIVDEPAKSVAEAGWTTAVTKLQEMLAAATVTGTCPGGPGGPLAPPTSIT